MKCIKGIWLRCGLLPYYLRGQQLALALLLRDKPRTAAQLAAALTEKGYPSDPQTLEKSLARLAKRGIVSVWRLPLHILQAGRRPLHGKSAARPCRHDAGHRKRHRLLHRCPACKRQLPRPQRLLNDKARPGMTRDGLCLLVCFL